ncbi:hypothetical protein [Thioalkalivibrio nitratireducens]|uniref:hypothetical protein n=1 Tax=Thioalkalivibrio nitratireducens TaxID=186931 RepID=UPI0005C190C1|nr:hypothetical protein [Thioalkalivibrio nitratireducens]
MTERPLSDEMLNAFVDRQLSAEDRLHVLRVIADDRHLGQEVCDRHRIKELVSLAYCQPGPPPRAVRSCGPRFWRWWRF